MCRKQGFRGINFSNLVITLKIIMLGNRNFTFLYGLSLLLGLI